jgi:hypothetical protein
MPEGALDRHGLRSKNTTQVGISPEMAIRLELAS